MFEDQLGEFSQLQREVGAAQAKLRQLEALLTSLPPPRSQVSPGSSRVLPLPGGPCRHSHVGPAHPSEPLPRLAFQKEAHVAARVWRELEKKRAVSGDAWVCGLWSGPETGTVYAVHKKNKS